MEIALIGGSFNPPHVGHLLAAHYVHATWPVDRVWFMPAFRHPFGKALAPYEHRLRMCELVATESSGWLEVSQVEREVGGEGWTIDTLRHLTATRRGDRFVLVIGSDILKDLPYWRDVEGIRQLARILVLHRAGYPSPEAFGPPLAQVSSTEIRRRLAQGESPRELVPHQVLSYASAHGLYTG